eukprot:7398975-Pyramimonas_sp.AAC.1
MRGQSFPSSECVASARADVAASPRYPVQLRLEAARADATVQVVRAPRRSPAEAPAGCALPPDIDRWSL